MPKPEVALGLPQNTATLKAPSQGTASTALPTASTSGIPKPQAQSLVRTNTLSSTASRSSLSKSTTKASVFPKPAAPPTAREELDRSRDQGDEHERLISRSPEIREALLYVESLTNALLECRQLIARDRLVLEEAAEKKRGRNSTAVEMAKEKEILGRLEMLTDRVSALVAKRSKIQRRLERVREQCIKMTLQDRIVRMSVTVEKRCGRHREQEERRLPQS